MNISVAVRFWLTVDSSGGPDACWPFLGSLEKSGYGQFKANGRMLKASRVAFAYAHNLPLDFSSTIHVLHSCDNPPCCNKRHLFAGPPQTNAKDRQERGRSAVGERNGRSKLQPETVLRIRSLAKQGVKHPRISEELKTNLATVKDIIHRRTWRHLP